MEQRKYGVGRSVAKGFMVFVEGGTLPKVLHKQYDSAFVEALRLSKLNPDRDCLLLEFHYRMRNGKRQETVAEVMTAPVVLARRKKQPK